MTLADTYQRLADAPAAFRALLSSASAAALAFREATDTWTPHEVLSHVTDAEVADWRPRVDAIVSDKGDHRFPPFDRVAGQRIYGSWPIAAVLDEFDRLRRDNLTYLAHLDLGATPNALARTGVHPEFGTVTLEQLLACWVVHDLAHISQISRVLVRHHGPDVGPWKKYFSLLSS